MTKHLLALLTAGLVAAACSDTNGLGPGDEPTVSLSFTTTGVGGPTTARHASFSRAAAADTIVSGTDSLIIDRVQIVLREIELERVEVATCDDDSLGVDDDACEEFEVGPILVELPLNGAVETPITIAVDTGSYDEIEFDIHKPSDDNAADSAFVAAHPDFAETSIRVTGRFNGTTFVYETDLNVEQEIALPQPLVVTDATVSTNVTLRVDLDAWFRDAAGALVNPQTANKGGQNENLVKDNIKDSFEAFEDDDRDGDDSDED